MFKSGYIAIIGKPNVGKSTLLNSIEKPSQKGILIGKGGAMLKEIGRQARLDMEKFFNAKIYLELVVRVRKNRTRDIRALRELGYAGEGS